MKQLITINDIIELKPMSVNIDVTKKLNFCISEAQKYDVMPFLGDTLYLLMEADFTEPNTFATAKYEQLFNGSDYQYSNRTFRHEGIKAMLIYYAYARYVQNSNVNHTAFGLVEKTPDHSTGVSKETLLRQISGATALAEAAKSKVELFLRYKIIDYPEWVYAQQQTKAPSGVKLNAIGGNGNKERIASSYRCRHCGRYSCVCQFS